MYKKIKQTIALTGTLLLTACSQSYDGLEIIQTDNIPPQKLTITEVVPKPGALEIHYELSKQDKDVAQIVASYTKNGEKKEFNTSRYVSSILVEGFMGPAEQTVDLQVVDNSGNTSEITQVKATPLKSPVEEAFEALHAEQAFGGVRLSWKNTSGDFLTIHVLTNDTLQIKGDTVFIEDPSKIIYTRDTVSANTFTYIRNYPPVEQKFGFSITDKWGNRTDTLVAMITPIREDHVESNQIRVIEEFGYEYTNGKTKDYDQYGFLDAEKTFQKDSPFYAGWAGPATLFNGNVGPAGEFYCTKFTKNYNDADPDNDEFVQSAFISYDLRCDVQLGRFKVWWRSNAWQGGNTRRWRFWGTTDKNPAWRSQFPEGWDLVGEYQVKDPVNPGSPTDEEVEMWVNGIDFNIKDDNLNPDAKTDATIRYIRIEMVESFDPTLPQYTFNEMEFWGEIENKYY